MGGGVSLWQSMFWVMGRLLCHDLLQLSALWDCIVMDIGPTQMS